MKLLLKYTTFFICSLLMLSCGTNKKIIHQGSKITIETHTYSKNKNNHKLDLDYYISNVYKNELPLIIYVHGGGFSGGSKDQDFIQRYCIEMAKSGFAVASISYRLTMKKYGFGCNTATSLKINAFNSASEDISLATNYLLKHQNKLRLDAKNIILVGSSAGAEAILNLVYVYKNNILPKYFKYAGLIAMAGAVTTLENITQENAIPTQLFHGVEDKLVPYNVAPHHYCDTNSKGYLTLYGSKAIANKLKELNQSYYLQTIEDGNHSWNAKPMYLNMKEMLRFIDEQIIQKKVKQIEIIKKESDYNLKEM